MANLPEIPAFDEGVYQIEQTDPVLGGAPNPATGAGLVNIPHQQLARRTRYLKQQIDAIEAELAQYPLDGLAPRQSPAFTGNPTAPTQPQDTNNTRLATTAFVLGQAGSAAPLAAGTAAAGTSPRYARQDHRHPTDTTRAPLASPAFTGNPTAPTQARGNNSDRLATTAFIRDEFDASLSASGWQRLASGLIIQWGSGSYNASDGATGTQISLPIAFPISFYQVVASDIAQGANSVAAAISGLTALRVWARTPGGSFANTQISWIAFGR